MGIMVSKLIAKTITIRLIILIVLNNDNSHDIIKILKGGIEMAVELEQDKLYKLSEVSKITNIPQSTLAKYARESRIKATKFGKIWRMSGEWVKEFMEHGTENPEEKHQKIHDLIHGFAEECRRDSTGKA
jgi:excisionase family DNA binding protein